MAASKSTSRRLAAVEPESVDRKVAIEGQLHIVEDTLLRQAYEVEALLACARSHIEPFMQVDDTEVCHAASNVDVVLRVTRDHVAVLGEQIQLAIVDVRRMLEGGAPTITSTGE